MAVTLTLLASGVIKQSTAPSALDDVVLEVQYADAGGATSIPVYGIGNTNASAGVGSASKITNFLMGLAIPEDNTDTDLYSTVSDSDGQAQSLVTFTTTQDDDLTMLLVGKSVI